MDTYGPAILSFVEERLYNLQKFSNVQQLLKNEQLGPRIARKHVLFKEAIKGESFIIGSGPLYNIHVHIQCTYYILYM